MMTNIYTLKKKTSFILARNNFTSTWLVSIALVITTDYTQSLWWRNRQHRRLGSSHYRLFFPLLVPLPFILQFLPSCFCSVGLAQNAVPSRKYILQWLVTCGPQSFGNCHQLHHQSPSVDSSVFVVPSLYLWFCHKYLFSVSAQTLIEWEMLPASLSDSVEQTQHRTGICEYGASSWSWRTKERTIPLE